MIHVTGTTKTGTTAELAQHSLTACFLFLPKLLGLLVKLKKMFFGKQFWQSLACFVIGGIITVIFIKLLEWQRNHNHELGDKQILVPVQEVGDGEREQPMEIRKFPREQDDF